MCALAVAIVSRDVHTIGVQAVFEATVFFSAFFVRELEVMAHLQNHDLYLVDTGGVAATDYTTYSKLSFS